MLHLSYLTEYILFSTAGLLWLFFVMTGSIWLFIRGQHILSLTKTSRGRYPWLELDEPQRSKMSQVNLYANKGQHHHNCIRGIV